MIGDWFAGLAMAFLSGWLLLLVWALSMVALAVLCLACRRWQLREVVVEAVELAVAERLAELVPEQRDGGHDQGTDAWVPQQRDGQS